MADKSHMTLMQKIIAYTAIVVGIVKLGSRSKVYLKSLIRDLDLELVAIIAMSPTIKLF